jgi:hypothetical protein
VRFQTSWSQIHKILGFVGENLEQIKGALRQIKRIA